MCHRYGAVNLAQGFPDFDPPVPVKEAAKRAIDDGFNQYSITWGSATFRQAIARKMAAFNGLQVDPELHITVTCGSTEAMMAAMLAVVDPGDEVVVFEPFYENYGPDAILSGAVPRFVPLRGPGFTFDPDELEAAFVPRTRAIIVNTPHNPTGKVFGLEELQVIARLCREHGCIAITDEIYERIIYGGLKHISLATLPGMWERTVTICGHSKTYSVTGWRLAYAVAAEEITGAIRKVHDFLTVGAPAPLQEAGAVALELGGEFYRDLVESYDRRRKFLLETLSEAGFICYDPKGAYYIMADIDQFGFKDDTQFAHFLVKEVGVGAVPGSSFYSRRELGTNKIRFTFSKRDETLTEAAERLSRLKDKV